MNKYILFIFVGYLALLQYRVYINIKSSQGDTALHFVVAGGHINLIKLAIFMLMQSITMVKQH